MLKDVAWDEMSIAQKRVVVQFLKNKEEAVNHYNHTWDFTDKEEIARFNYNGKIWKAWEEKLWEDYLSECLANSIKQAEEMEGQAALSSIYGPSAHAVLELGTSP